MFWEAEQEFEMQHEHYLEELVLHYTDHMDWYKLRFVQTMDFMPPTI